MIICKISRQCKLKYRDWTYLFNLKNERQLITKYFQEGHAIVFLSDSLDDDNGRSADVSGGRVTGPAELTADAAAAAAAAAKNGDGAAPPEE